ncbi:MAG: aldehyde ferredoxin oxidoreductase family protein [Thermoplasmata archaeon]|nr:aldehyde ferredoxin oxidoreductase family protein [Thermoplasmata archaeon]
MYGWTGRLLRIDLSEEKIREERIPEGILRDYVGGRGLGVKLYYDSVSPKIDPFAEKNLLVFVVGPLTGATPMSGRHVVVSKSPLTGTIFDSNSGGFWGKELHYAGYDALIIQGKAEKPVYLSIHDDEVEIKNANALWGLNVDEVTSKLEEEGSVACIGRAGERGVLYANIMNDLTHTAGRGGLGAIMGSKRLKAIVVRGTKKPEIANLEDYKIAMKEMVRLLEASPPLNKGLRVFGTSMLYDIVNYLEVMPTNNYRSSHFKGGEKLSEDYILEHYEIESHGCWGCPINCKKRDKKRNVELPEYETIWAFGPNIENRDYEKIVEANIKCNRYGIDTITAGATIALYREITKEDYLDRIEDIGEGKFLTEGAKRLAEKFNALDKSTDVKGLELPGYDPRGLYGQALSYATSNRGGCHLRAYLVAPEIIGKPKLIHRLNPEDKPGLVVIFQNLSAAVDSLVLCKFTIFAMGEVEYSKLLSSVTGMNYRSEDILLIGERIYNLERLFNVEAGIGGEEDTLPPKIFSGENALDRVIFERMLREYYEFREWEDGVPTEDKLKRLKLK